MQAYLEAMKAGDFDAMYAVYAVESYCEGYDLGRQIEYVGAFSPAFSGMYLGTPAESGGDAPRGRSAPFSTVHFCGSIRLQYGRAFLDT